MKFQNIKRTEAPRIYGMSASRFESVLSRLGWLKHGEVQPAGKVYLAARELTPRGQGFLSVALRKQP